MNFNGHPHDVTRRVRATITRAARAGLIPTATTDGSHATYSWHAKMKGRNKRGCAVDLGFSALDMQRLTPAQRRERLVAFQLAEYRFAKRRTPAFRTFLEVLGPDNEYALLRGLRADLLEGSALETQHDNHVHIARAPLSLVPKAPARKVSDAVKDARYALIGRAHGMQHALVIATEARRAGVETSLAFALFEQESHGANVFGHDPTIFVGAGTVTEAKFVAYRNRRLASGNRLMQGVGPGQLTWWEFQDEADREGGCHRVRPNVRVSLRILKRNMARGGRRVGIARYNGTGPAADSYARSVEAKAERWKALL